MFIGFLSFSNLLASMVNVSSLTCISLLNQPCMTRPTLIYINPNEYNSGFCCSLFTVSLDSGLEFVTLSMISLIKYVLQTKQKIEI